MEAKLKPEAFLSKLHSVAAMARGGATAGERAASLEALRRLIDRARLQSAQLPAGDAEAFLAGVASLTGTLAVTNAPLMNSVGVNVGLARSPAREFARPGQSRMYPPDKSVSERYLAERAKLARTPPVLDVYL